MFNPPPPTPRRSYGFHEMGIGDYKSFTFEDERAALSCQCAAVNIANRRSWKFVTQKTRLADCVIVVNVWRLKNETLSNNTDK